MNLDELLRAAVGELRRQQVTFAVAGGFAASLYRVQPRLTMDIDLGILADAGAQKTAVVIIEGLGLQANVVREADLAGAPQFAIRQQRTRPCVIVGRPRGEPDAPGVDILLPAIPWVTDAVQRAQANAVDFGFGTVPTLTLEDILVAKLYALRAIPLRAKDLDDLQSIFAAGQAMDQAYLAGQIRRFQIVIPSAAKPFLPPDILRLVRDCRRQDLRQSTPLRAKS